MRPSPPPPHADAMDMTTEPRSASALRPSAPRTSAPPPSAHTVAVPRAAGGGPPDAATRAGRTPRLGIALIAAGAFGLEMAVRGRSGCVRAELAFLSPAHHLAFGHGDK